MSVSEYLEEMKKVHESLLVFLQDEFNYEESFQNLQNSFQDIKICDDSHKLKILLHLILKLSNNYHRSFTFFSKIERILNFFKDNIKKYYSNSEIFNIFKSNKRILLFLIESKIITIDDFIVKTITKGKYLKCKYPQYFQPEIEPFNKEDWYPKNIQYSSNYNELSENFYEKRKIGENDNFICQLIQKDSIDEFILYINQNDDQIKLNIQPSIYETNSLLLQNKEISLIEYAAFFGSIQIIQFLAINGFEFLPSIWIYAIHSQNPQLIQILEDKNVLPEDKSYKKCMNEIIKCHHNDIANYITKYLGNEDENSFDFFVQSIKCYNFIFIRNEFINQNQSFKFLCKYDYYNIVAILIKNKGINEKQISALFLAVEKGRFDIINLLLNNENSDANAKNQIIKDFLNEQGKKKQNSQELKVLKDKDEYESKLDKDECESEIDKTDGDEHNSNEEESNSNEMNEDEEVYNDEELNITDDDNDNIFGSSDNSSSIQLYSEYDMFIGKLIKDINFCKAYLIDFEFDDPFSSKITFRIPTSILPISVSVVNGFYNSPYLIQCTLDMNLTDTYKTCPKEYEFISPSYGKRFPGLILIKNRLKNFFTSNYSPQNSYKCQNYVLAPEITVDESKITKTVECLIDEGFPEKRAKKALLFCSYDIDKARDFLVSGLLKQQNFPIQVNYSDCPLFYLILEICEAFFDMEDCCCVCGRKLGVYNLKPACCNEEFCQFSFVNLGIGSNIIGEIKRDPIATDFIIVLAGAAYKAPENPPVFDPSPIMHKIPFNGNFFERLPSMELICTKCNTDTDLRSLIGANNFEILRFFILSNKAQLITLSNDLKTSIDVNGFQFLVTSVSPESELAFREKRAKFGVKWFWHGSHAERWYRILHTGLKDMGKTIYELNGGPWYGDGIYMSDSFNYSLSYCKSALNIYKNSKLPKNLYVISLVENADVKELSGPVALNEYTQRDDSACITRVLFLIDENSQNKKANIFIPGDSSDYNTLKNPPKVPSLQDVLSHQVKKFI